MDEVRNVYSRSTQSPLKVYLKSTKHMEVEWTLNRVLKEVWRFMAEVFRKWGWGGINFEHEAKLACPVVNFNRN